MASTSPPLAITPLYGSSSSKSDQLWCSDDGNSTLVEWCGVRILVNVGLTEDIPETWPAHDALLLTDASLSSCGALPLYVRTMKSNIVKGLEVTDQPDQKEEGVLPPIFATFPTQKIGQLTLYDLHARLCLDGGKPDFSLDELDDCASQIHCVKYSQPISLGTGNLSLTLLPAGHLLGASLLRLHCLIDDTVTVLIPRSYQVAREWHLDSSPLLQAVPSPDVLITYAGGMAAPVLNTVPKLYKPPRLAAQSLSQHVLATLRRDGNVLLPTDAAGRVVEVLGCLYTTWQQQRLTGTYGLVWYHPLASTVAQSVCLGQLEWMSRERGKEFDAASNSNSAASTSIWRFGTVRQQQQNNSNNSIVLCATLQELQQYLADSSLPTCVVASGLSMENGPSRNVLQLWADGPDNAIILTDSRGAMKRNDEVVNLWNLDEASTSKNLQPHLTVAAQLLSAWLKQQKQDSVDDEEEEDDAIPVVLPVPQRKPLAGPALTRFLEHERAVRRQERERSQQEALLRTVEQARGELRLGGGDTAMAAAPTAKASGQQQQHQSRPKKKSRFDTTLFLKFSKPLHCKLSRWRVSCALLG